MIQICNICFSDVLDCIDLPPLEDPLKKSPDSPLFESILKFEDAEDCTSNEKMTNALNKTESEITCSSEEEKITTRKTRKPKPKLGVKITKEKENASLVESELNPPKRSWNIVAASKPPKERIIDLDLPEIECVETFTLKLPKKENLIDIDVEENTKNEEVAEDFNLLKIDKSSDENGSPTDTTESDDSSKIPAIVEDENTAPAQNLQSSSKNSRRKSKKKRK